MHSSLACDDEITFLEVVVDQIGRVQIPECLSGWASVQTPQQFDIENLDPVVLGQFFGVGFTLVATVLIGAIGAKTVLDFIKSA